MIKALAFSLDYVQKMPYGGSGLPNYLMDQFMIKTVKERSVVIAQWCHQQVLLLGRKYNKGGDNMSVAFFLKGLRLRIFGWTRVSLCIICDSRGVPDIYEEDGASTVAASEPSVVLVNMNGYDGMISMSLNTAIRSARHVISSGPSWSTANLPCKQYFAGMRRHGWKQRRSTPVVSLFGLKTAKKTTRETVVPDPDYRLPIAILVLLFLGWPGWPEVSSL